MSCSAELWDQASGACTATGSLHVPRADLRLVTLASGEVLALGGWNDDGLALTAVETCNPETGPGPSGRLLPWRGSGTLHRGFPRGRVLLLGGADDSGAWPMKAADLDD